MAVEAPPSEEELTSLLGNVRNAMKNNNTKKKPIVTEEPVTELALGEASNELSGNRNKKPSLNNMRKSLKQLGPLPPVQPKPSNAISQKVRNALLKKMSLPGQPNNKPNNRSKNV
jgi:hypothetical protein